MWRGGGCDRLSLGVWYRPPPPVGGTPRGRGSTWGPRDTGPHSRGPNGAVATLHSCDGMSVPNGVVPGGPVRVSICTRDHRGVMWCGVGLGPLARRAHRAKSCPISPPVVPPLFPPFLSRCWGPPPKAGVMQPLRPHVGPRDGGGEVAWA